MGDSQCGGAGDHAVIILIEVLLRLLEVQTDEITWMKERNPEDEATRYTYRHKLGRPTHCTAGHGRGQLKSPSDWLPSRRDALKNIRPSVTELYYIHYSRFHRQLVE